MQLYIRRALQKEKQGFMRGGGEVTKFALYARLELTPEEVQLINTYRLGQYFIWERSQVEIDEFIRNKQTAVPETIQASNLTGQGTSRTFDSFVFMLNAEDRIKNNVKDFSNHVKEAQEFETEQVFEF
jgi:hypothetical protein